jgi:hypothetical protein
MSRGGGRTQCDHNPVGDGASANRRRSLEPIPKKTAPTPEYAPAQIKCTPVGQVIILRRCLRLSLVTAFIYAVY